MPDEVIVVDNGSTDATVGIVKQFPFVRIVSQPKPGLRNARNAGINASRSDIVGRIDADCRLTENWAEIVRSNFNYVQTEAIIGPCYYHDMPLKRTGLFLDRYLRRGLFWLDKGPLLFGSNMAIRRTAWKKVEDRLCKQGEFFEDYDITIHLRQKKMKIAFVPEMVVGVSSRRLDDSPLLFRQNMRLHTKTFEKHDQKSLAATLARYIYVISYYPLRVLRHSYDPHKQKLSLHKTLKHKAQPRPTSNT